MKEKDENLNKQKNIRPWKNRSKSEKQRYSICKTKQVAVKKEYRTRKIRFSK